jgi:hypothetical protein
MRQTDPETGAVMKGWGKVKVVVLPAATISVGPGALLVPPKLLEPQFAIEKDWTAANS